MEQKQQRVALFLAVVTISILPLVFQYLKGKLYINTRALYGQESYVLALTHYNMVMTSWMVSTF